MTPQCQCPYGQPSPKRSRGSQILVAILVFISAAFVIGFGSYAVFLTVQQHMSQTASPGGEDTAVSQGQEQEQSSGTSQTNNPIGTGTDPSFEGVTLEKASEEPISAGAVYNTVSPSVASVAVTERGETYYGSAIVLTKDGYLLTAASVIGYDRDAKVTVRANDGVESAAVVVGFDSTMDIAVLKAEGKFTPARFTKGKLAVGDAVYTVTAAQQNAYNGVLASGMVSSTDRIVSYDSVSSGGYYQIDVSVSLSGSGGAVVNEAGQVVGLVTIDDEGNSYALPITQAADRIKDLIQKGYVSGKARLGISGMAVTIEEVEAYGVPRGVVILSLQEDGGFAGTKAQVGDIITKMDGVSIITMGDISAVLENHQPGDQLEVELSRIQDNGDIETLTVTVTLREDAGETQG